MEQFLQENFKTHKWDSARLRHPTSHTRQKLMERMIRSIFPDQEIVRNERNLDLVSRGSNFSFLFLLHISFPTSEFYFHRKTREKNMQERKLSVFFCTTFRTCFLAKVKIAGKERKSRFFLSLPAIFPFVILFFSISCYFCRKTK